MYVLIWRYRVLTEKGGPFLEHYGPEGSWAQLFHRAPGYLGTELLRGSADPSVFLTVDRWESRRHHEAFLDAFRSEYEALDRACEALTAKETFLGAYGDA